MLWERIVYMLLVLAFITRAQGVVAPYGFSLDGAPH